MGAESQRTTVTRRSDSLAPLSGGLAALLTLGASAQADLGGWGAYPTMPDDALTALFVARVADSRLGAVTMMVAALLMLVFAAVLWDRLRLIDEPAWPAALAAGGALLAAVMMTDVAKDAFGQVVVGETGDAVTARVLIVTAWQSANVGLVPIAAIVTGVAIAGWRGAFRRRFAVPTMIAAVALLSGVLVAPLTDVWLLPIAVLALVVISVALAFGTPMADARRPADPPASAAGTVRGARDADLGEEMDIELT